MQVPVAVCISTWNRANDLKRCIDCIYNQDYPKHLIEIIIVDNHSTDATEGYIRNLSWYVDPKITYIRLDKPNPNAIQTINQSLRIAYNNGFKYSIVLDDDAFMENSNVISSLISTMETNEDVAICGVHVTNLIGEGDALPVEINYQSNYLMQPYALKEHPNFCGACAIFRCDACGPEFYNESYVLYWNEPELSVKMLNNGYRVCINDSVHVLHGSQVGRIKIKRLYYGIRNSIKFTNAYLERKQRCIIVPMYSCLALYELITKFKVYVTSVKDISYIIKLLLWILYSHIMLIKSSSCASITSTDVKNYYFMKFMENILVVLMSNKKE